ncbi:MAG: hypothetical protein KDK70_09570 [Myxococcales bacterium]|nr:hypothetical protein [Myxococcales bacterium]
MSEHAQRGPAKGLMDEDGRGPRVRLPDDEASSRMQLAMLRKVGPGMLVLVLCVVATYVVPSLRFARPWTQDDPVPFWNLLGRPFEAAALQERKQQVAKVDAIAQEVLAQESEPVVVAEPEPVVVVEPDVGFVLPPYEPHPDDAKAVEQSVELPTGHELDRFFDALAHSDASVAGAVTRVVHWGDSAIGIDGIPSAIRKRLQARFGDGGHGFHLMAPPNTSYRHRGIHFSHNGQWGLCFIIHKCRSDGHYGLGGATFRSSGGAQSSFGPDPKHSAGRVSRFVVHYAAQPRGGRIRLRVDGQEPVFLSTEADVLEDRVHVLEVDDGPHELQVRASGGGRVRLYGVVMERDGPGVVWDGLALVGAFTRRLLEFDETHLRDQLAQRQPHLAVLTFGGNDMVRRISMETFEQEYRQVLQRLREARPQMDCLVMSPLDHGERKGVRIVSLPVVSAMVEAQRRAARAEGCAFFDTVAAMGGDGAAGRWRKADPPLLSGDLAHLTVAGQKVVGQMVYLALMEGYRAYRKREG